MKRWANIKYAAEYSSIGMKRLKDLAKDKIIIGFVDPDNGRGDWIFDLMSIDEYRMRQYEAPEDRLKVERIMRSYEAFQTK